MDLLYPTTYQLLWLSCALGLLGCSSPPNKRLLDITPQQQAPRLCGVSSGEMILSYYGITQVGHENQYTINQDSQGSALGQHVCDLLAANTPGLKQPKCVDKQGRELQVYHEGKPTKNSRAAFWNGTWLTSVQHVLKLKGIPSTYTRSAMVRGQKRYDPSRVATRVDAVLKHLRRGHPSIIHVTPRLKPGGGHYLLAMGYDDTAKRLYYIDPNPVGEDTSISSVAYDKIRNGSGWFRGRYFFTGRYLAVTKAR